MGRKKFDDILVSINEELVEFSKTSSKQFINDLHVPDLLVGRVNGPYQPEIIRIGLHYGSVWYEGKYKDKYRYLQLLLKRRNETSVEKYLVAMTKLEERALKCYEYYSSRDSQYFVKKMFLDSCFIVELFRMYAMKELRDKSDPIFNTGQSLHVLRRDLISIENQLPFFVLVEYFNMTRMQDDPRDNLVDLSLHFFENMVGHTLNASDRIPIHEINHLLSLVHDTLCLPLAETSKNFPTTEMEVELEFINCATELQEAGIKFKKIKGRNLLNMKFINGIMEIPPLKVADNTIYLLRNLMEYEKQFPISVPRYVNDYAKFIQCLLNSPKDVELLRRNGIIENWWGNDELIFDTINKVGSEAQISCNLFTYSQLLKKVNKHCRRRRNVWMANLWRNYFNSPWALVSFIAAVVLLVLTLTQTVFSILSSHP